MIKLEEDYCMQYKKEKAKLLKDWNTATMVVKDASRNVLGMTSGQRRDHKETQWINEEYLT